jgi:hypothetical protein
MVIGMAKPLRIEIKQRMPPPLPYKWELYEEGKSLPIKTSEISYRTENEAMTAAHEALDQRERLRKIAEKIGDDDEW